jgi:hypothetical protein
VSALLLIGDVFDRMATLPSGSYDLILCSPPFLDLRSYLNDCDPNKAKEIGSEPTPADFIDVMLALTAEWRRLLTRHGSIAIEFGDTYSDGFPGWPVAKSLAGIPDAYMLSLIYGWNVLRRNAPDSPAGQWRIRNLKPWIRTNPPVGALGDKERPATSYITVACTSKDRWFDLDAVRTALAPSPGNRYVRKISATDAARRPDGSQAISDDNRITKDYDPSASAGAPPLDWWHQTDATIDDEIQQRAGKPVSSPRTAKGAGPRANSGKAAADGRGGQWSTLAVADTEGGHVGARGWHIRRRLEQAGILPPHPDALDISPRGYSGAHYAVWPPELCRVLIDEMCPRRVCTMCGQPSRRLSENTFEYQQAVDEQMAICKAETSGSNRSNPSKLTRGAAGLKAGVRSVPYGKETVGWSDCGHNTWRPGRILDPFVGSGTTLAVASGMGRDSIGIDIDLASYGMALERVGPLLFEVNWPEPNWKLRTLPIASTAPGAYDEWTHMLGEAARVAAERELDPELTPPRPLELPAPRRNGRRPIVDVPGQAGLFA